MVANAETYTGRGELLRSRERLDSPNQFGIFAHFYQPPRVIQKPDGTRVEILPSVNHQIYSSCYEPMLVKPREFPRGFAFSFYTGLREWMMNNYPKGYEVAIENIQSIEDKEYGVFGDTFIHAILPLLPLEDQEILIRAGKEAFFEDFDFDPKGLWLPETAVTMATLEIAARNGYEFVPLSNYQLEPSSTEPVLIRFKNGEEINIIPFDSQISGQLSFDNYARMNADTFLGQYVRNFASNPGRTKIIASDGELYGHHDPDGNKFLEYLLRMDVLAQHRYQPLSIKDKLNNETDGYATIHDYSSWSDQHDHRLGRWKGECCGNTTPEGKQLFNKLQGQNREINTLLDSRYSPWREEFVLLIVALRNEILAGGDIIGQLESNIKDETKRRYFAAKIYALLGFISCGWFFDGAERPERQIPREMTDVVGKLLKDEYSTQEGRINIFPVA